MNSSHIKPSQSRRNACLRFASPIFIFRSTTNTLTSEIGIHPSSETRRKLNFGGYLTNKTRCFAQAHVMISEIKIVGVSLTSSDTTSSSVSIRAPTTAKRRQPAATRIVPPNHHMPYIRLTFNSFILISIPNLLSREQFDRRQMSLLLPRRGLRFGVRRGCKRARLSAYRRSKRYLSWSRCRRSCTS